jgi:hypothetical protein
MGSIVSLPESPAMSDDRNPAAARTPAGQPFGVILAGLASGPGTWDKNDHGREGLPRNRYPAKAIDSEAPPSLLSIRFHAEKESHLCIQPIGRLSVTTF